jgi:hypothetical protein
MNPPLHTSIPLCLTISAIFRNRGYNPPLISQQLLGNRGYTNEVCLPYGKGFAQRGLLNFLKPAKAGFVVVLRFLTAKPPLSDRYPAIGNRAKPPLL